MVARLSLPTLPFHTFKIGPNDRLAGFLPEGPAYLTQYDLGSRCRANGGGVKTKSSCTLSLAITPTSIHMGRTL